MRSLQSFLKVSASSCPCPCSQRLRGHRVHIVNDNADTQFSKISNYNLLLFYFFYFFKSKIICQRRRWLRGHTFFANIFAKKKNFAKLFLPVHMGPRWSFLNKKCRKSRDTVPLSTTNQFLQGGKKKRLFTNLLWTERRPRKTVNSRTDLISEPFLFWLFFYYTSESVFSFWNTI